MTADECDWTRWQNLINLRQITGETIEEVEVTLTEPWNSPKFWADVKYTGNPNNDSLPAPICAIG